MKVAIIGAGQLARMLALSGIPKGIHFSFLLSESENEDCVGMLGKCVHRQDTDSYETIYKALNEPDVITIESENVDIDLLEGLSRFCPTHPNLKTIRTLKNRFGEKTLLSENKINTSRFFHFDTHEQLCEKYSSLKLPLVIKSCTGGYDGKFQYILKNDDDIKNFREVLNSDISFPDGFIAEEFIHFEREVSFIGARSLSGEIKFYSPTENIHQNAILHKSVSPAKNTKTEVIETGNHYLKTIMESLNYVGVLAMECFEVVQNGKSELVVNELAPRVHNSGHWTQAGATTDQFENHVRAILGLNLGATDNIKLSGMVNVLGKPGVDINQLDSHASLHWYNKESRKNRKMGHINILEESYEQLDHKMDSIIKYLDKI